MSDSPDTPSPARASGYPALLAGLWTASIVSLLLGGLLAAPVNMLLGDFSDLDAEMQVVAVIAYGLILLVAQAYGGWRGGRTVRSLVAEGDERRRHARQLGRLFATLGLLGAVVLWARTDGYPRTGLGPEGAGRPSQVAEWGLLAFLGTSALVSAACARAGVLRYERRRGGS